MTEVTDSHIPLSISMEPFLKEKHQEFFTEPADLTLHYVKGTYVQELFHLLPPENVTFSLLCTQEQAPGMVASFTQQDTGLLLSRLACINNDIGLRMKNALITIPLLATGFHELSKLGIFEPQRITLDPDFIQKNTYHDLRRRFPDNQMEHMAAALHNAVVKLSVTPLGQQT